MVIKRLFILFILLIRPAITQCQISDDSLKKYVLESPFTKYITDNELDAMSDIDDRMHPGFDTLQELFPGYFKNARLFLASYWNVVMHGVQRVPKLCLLDANTGKLVRFNKDDSFFYFVNSTSKEISNLDKAYLYLFLFRDILNTSQWSITRPTQYKADVGGNSTFRELAKDVLFLDAHCSGCVLNLFYEGEKHCEQMITTIRNSNNSKITMYSCDMGFSLPAYCYEFTFSENKISNVKVSSFFLKW